MTAIRPRALMYISHNYTVSMLYGVTVADIFVITNESSHAIPSDKQIQETFLPAEEHKIKEYPAMLVAWRGLTLTHLSLAAS